MSPVINGRTLYKNILNTKWMKTWIPEDPSAAAAKLALVSTITKDALGCAIYTTQSLNNEKIPEDKRKFVAANDLSNGVYNVAIPWILGNKITNASAKLFDGKFKDTLFDKNSAMKLYNKLEKLGVNCTAADVEKVLVNNSSKIAKAGMATVFTLILSQIGCKRIVTPLLATPTADYIKKGMEKYDERKATKANADGDTVSFSGKKEEESTAEAKAESSKFPTSITSPTFDEFTAMISKQPKFTK